jgi:Tol biopolymer transport system component
VWTRRPDLDAAVPPLPDAAVTGAFTTPAPIPGAHDPTNSEDDSTMSWSGSELVYALQLPGGKKHLYTMTYDETTKTFGTSQVLPFSTTASIDDESPRFAPGDLVLYFSSDRGNASGDNDINMVSRPSVGGAWGTPTKVTGPNNTGSVDKWYAPCNAASVYAVINTVGAQSHVFVGTVGQPPVEATELASAQSEISAFLSYDCLTIYFASNRSGAEQIYTAHRPDVATAFGPPILFAHAGSATAEEDPWLSPDGHILTFARTTGGQKDLYFSTR